MLITKFNRMIRNRLLWGIFAVIISVSFVGMFTADGGCEGVDPADAVAGTAGDVSVTHNELQRSRFFTMLHLSLMTGQPFVHQSPAMMREFEAMTWRRALALKKAEALGLRVTNEEILRQIEQDPMFSADGVFQRHFYDQFANGFLRRIGVSRRQYDDFIRDEILLEKLMRVLGTAVWVTPYEMEQHIQTYTDVFEVERIQLATDGLPAVPEPTADEVETYFAENPDEFSLPERIRVAYVIFPADDFVGDVVIDEEQIDDYYVDNLSEFRIEDDAWSPEDGERPMYREFDEVADEIRERLIQRQALFAAMDEATEFVLSLVPGRTQTQAVSFDDAAAAQGLEVSEAEPFSQVDPPPELDDLDPPVLMRHAFRLEDRPDEYFSDAIAGDSAAYVLGLRERIPAGIPPLDEVADRVRDTLIDQRVQAQLVERAAEIREALMAAMRADPEADFADIAMDKGLETVAYEPFSVFNAPETLEDADILHGITARNPGELTEWIEAPDGRSKWLFHIIDRESADEMSRGMLRQQIVGGISRQRAQQVFTDWQDYLFDALEETVREPEPTDEPDRDMGRRPIL